MSANLDMSRGRAAFAFCGEVAWHRQGVEVPEGSDRAAVVRVGRLKVQGPVSFWPDLGPWFSCEPNQP